jgi:polyhydroxyalkanoate synthesis regulator phasin
MLDNLKKTIYAGIGATVISAEKLNAVLDELVAKGKISTTEAKDLANKISEEGRKEFEQSSQRFGAQVDEWLKKANFARQKDLEELQARVAKLEARLGVDPSAQQQHQQPL